MSKLLVVFGATGHQGGSVVSYAAKELAGEYKIRAITRNPSKPSALKLKELGVEVVAGDATNEESLRRVLKGADTVFAMSAMSLDGTGDEFKVGKTIADAAIASGVEYFIWSTLPSVSKLSKGEFTHVEHFDKKAEVEDYIRGLPIKSSFYCPSVFLQNFEGMFKPQPTQNGVYSLFNIVDPKVAIPWIDVVADTGKYVGTILKSPDAYEGKTLYAASGLYSLEDIAEIISKVSKKKVVYTQIPEDTYSSLLPPAIAKDMVEMFEWYKFGYYGPETKKLLAQTASEVDFKPTLPEEYFKANPISFD